MKKSRQATHSPLLNRSSRIIGRENFLAAIRKAIADKAGRSRVLYFVGRGGIGKSRLLEEVANIQKEFKEKSFLWSGIIDLYHEENHSPDTLKEAIARGIDPKNQHFQKFWKLRELMKEKRRQGIIGPQLEEIRKQFNDQFLEEYEILASQRRLVLCFDTMELIQYESDFVQRICRVEDEDAVIKNWLLNQISQMPNTLTIFAGRPLPKLKKDFERAFKKADLDFDSYKLNEFTEKETQDYLDEMLRIHPNLSSQLGPTERMWVSKLSQGRPIRLALCIDLIQAGGGPLSSPDGKGDIDFILTENLLGLSNYRKLDSPFRELIEYLVSARKGLDYELLSYLTGWSKKKSRNNLRRVANLEIVKRRPGTEQLFLHDEIYDLADKLFKNKPRDTGKIAKYYRKLLESSDPDKHQELTVKLLYYEFQTSANNGYHYYARIDEDAIEGHEIGFDMRLRDEGLRFMDRYANIMSPYHDPRISDDVDRVAIDRDCAVRWVKRYRARGENKKALQVAERIRYSTVAGFNWESADPLYKASLLAAWVEAMIYTGSPENVIQESLEKVKNLLERSQNLNEDQEWWRTRILGRVYDLLGYLHRINGRYGLAVEQYKRALLHFTEAKIQDEKANSLNNLAYLLALLGRPEIAWNHVNQALKIRQKLGRKFPIALSLNTRGLIRILDDHPMWGERDCRKALAICEDLGDFRGIGLAHSAIGLALRKRGDQWKLESYTPAQAEKYFLEASKQLLKAVDVFSKAAPEPIRLWEAFNELGSLYCDWGWLVRNNNRNQTKASTGALEQYKQSIDYQEKALKLAQTYNLSFQVIDSYDDLAQVQADRSFLLFDIGRSREARIGLRSASSYLGKVDQLVPEEYRVEEGRGFQLGLESGEAYWLALGKMRLQHGIWIFEMLRREQKITDEERNERIRQGINHFAFATIYFQQYWPQSHAFKEGLSTCASRLQRAEVPMQLAKVQIEELSNLLWINLDPMLKVVEDVLGV